jgi:DNA-binding NarL/FixJ family response regulator
MAIRAGCSAERQQALVMILQAPSRGPSVGAVSQGCEGRQLLPELRIFVADDHELMRRGVRALLEAEAGWKVVGEASDGAELMKKVTEAKPDILVLDIGMPHLNGLEAARRLKNMLPEIKILILSMHDSEQMARDVLEAGARGYVTKADTARDLVLAVEALRRNKTFFTPRMDQLVLETFLREGTGKLKTSAERLTSRQREIVQLLAEGKSSKEIAVHLDISVKTVETHRANIMRRLSCHSVSDLVVYAIRNGIVHV